MVSHSVVSKSLQPHELQPVRLLCPWEFSRQEYWNGLPGPPPRDLLNPRIESRSPTFQADSLPSKPPGKPKNTGVSSLFLLQGIFLTQESNQRPCIARSPAMQADSLPTELSGKSKWKRPVTKDHILNDSMYVEGIGKSVSLGKFLETENRWAAA